MLEHRELDHEVSSEIALPLTAAVAGCGIGLWAIDAHGTFRADRATLAIWGRSYEELADSDSDAPVCFVHPEDRARLEVLLGRATDLGHDNECTFRALQPDGSTRWLLCRRSAFADETHGDLMTGIVLDLSSLRRAEDSRQRLRASEAVATLAARLAHDFNNLLFAILGNATLALGTVQLTSDHPIRESLREIQRAGERASEIVQRLSAFARPVQPRRQRIKLSGSLAGAIGVLRDRLPSAVTLRSQLPDNEPLVSADPKLVQDVFAFLLMNAAQAMEHRGGEVAIELEDLVLATEPWLHEFALAPGRYVDLRVRDTGAGMDPSTVRRAIEPFFSTRPKGAGMGLGLSIAHGILKSHGGALRIESVPGRGTTVHAYFPQL
ncbi:MAG TPA: ATP-binding protein [Polyangiales bacterium]|nr:ATP-binding protein [Polyangiales bacterium]